MPVRQRTLMQVTLAIAGVAIVGVTLIGARAREGVTMVTAPAAVVAPNAVTTHAQGTARTAPAAPAPGGPAAPGVAPVAPVAPVGDPAPPRAAVPGAQGHAPVDAGRLPAVSRAAGRDRTLVADDFERDPLAARLPSGWRLDDTPAVAQAIPILGGLPVVGGLVSGAGPASDLTPSTVLDGSHVLVRGSGSWSHLSMSSAGAWVDYSAGADVKPLSAGRGFVGVAGRFRDAANHLTCGIRDGSSLQLWQVVDGQQQLLASALLPVTQNAFHTIRMDMTGGQVTCSLDGAMLLRGTTSSMVAGRLGLIALGDVPAEFDNVRAIALS